MIRRERRGSIRLKIFFHLYVLERTGHHGLGIGEMSDTGHEAIIFRRGYRSTGSLVLDIARCVFENTFMVDYGGFVERSRWSCPWRGDGYVRTASR